jgi:glycosyltransferase involved in cell wall biosynthesis
MARRTVSLITTVFNEEDTIGPLLDSIQAQTRRPDDIVIVDAGSTDRTRGIISEHIARGLPARLLVEPGANRARGRNLAIREATGVVIASIDAGCVAEPEWLARLVAPFESGDPPDVVSGYYRPEATSIRQQAIAAATVPDVSEVDPEAFDPSSRSAAFTRAAWERAGGYPEYVDFAEDTGFDRRLRAAGCRFLFEPAAIVRWRVQPDLVGVFRQFRRYARSDGELGYWFGHYTKAFAVLLGLLLLIGLVAWLPPSTGRLALAGVLLVAAVAYWARYERRARQRGARRAAAVFAGDVMLTVDVAHVLGYTAGWLRRRPRPAPLPTDRPLSVAQITYTYKPIAGGADVYASQLAELISAAGHTQRVYQRAAPITARDTRFIPNPWRGLPLEFWTQALALFRLRRELLSHDVVICHYPHYLLALDLMGLFGRKPVRVALSHGVFWDDSPGSPRSAVKAWIARLAFRRAHLYIANDTHFLRAMGLRIAPRQRMFSQIAPGVWFIPNGVDIAEFRPVEPVREMQERKAILVPRNLFRNRGVHLAIKAFAQFRQDHPDTALFIVGGAGQRSYVAALKEDVKRRGLEDAVIFYGAVPHDELPAIYSSAQLTLIPSLCGEGTSLSALESMACGTPTICTYVAGLKDLPGPHAPPTALGLAKTMHRVYANLDRVGEEQRRAVLADYSIQKWQHAWRAALTGAGVSTGPTGESPQP